MTSGRGARASAQDELVTHKLAVVFANQARRGNKSRIRHVWTGRPFPHISEPVWPGALGRLRLKFFAFLKFSWSHVSNLLGCNLPLFLPGKSRASPARECICFVVAEMANRCSRINFSKT